VGSRTPDWSRTLVPTHDGATVEAGAEAAVSLDWACLRFRTGPATANVACIQLPSGRVVSVHDVPTAGPLVVSPSSATATVLLAVPSGAARLFSLETGQPVYQIQLPTALSNASRSATLGFTAVLSLPTAFVSLALCNATTVVAACALPAPPPPPSGGSSSSSSSGDDNVAASNLAATVGAGIGVLFLIGFNRYLEWKYPHARRLTAAHDRSLRELQLADAGVSLTGK
jgi:hypothetical protein